MSKPTVDVVHFSDVLCIWAYITQIRVAELQTNFPDEVHLDYRFLQVFGDASGKIAAQWGDRGGLPAYAAHVQEVAATFPHISISSEAWLVNTPTSSLPAHVMLCGAKVLCATDPGGVDADLVERLLGALRHGFFVETADISRQSVLLEIAAQADVDIKALARLIDNGMAHAQLADDLAAAAQNAVRASPTLLMNEGRQVLTGNVGYRVLEANIRELLHSPGEQQSWC
jgi:predicted DsbA family dithiol-disulfide isomerase